MTFFTKYQTKSAVNFATDRSLGLVKSVRKDGSNVLLLTGVLGFARK